MPKAISIMIDEAGRWPLAGPVTVGAAIKRKRIPLSAYTDSKLLSQTQRNNLYTEIIDQEAHNALFTWVWRWSASKIDKWWIIVTLREATLKAIFLALKKFYKQVRIKQLTKEWKHETITALESIFKYRRIWAKTINTLFTYLIDSYVIKHIIIDGNNDFWLGKRLIHPVETLIKWDQKNKYISIASIVAKVDRDEYMRGLDKKYPAYGFYNHVGYWTRQHREAIQKHGISRIHRKTFCRNVTSGEE